MQENKRGARGAKGAKTKRKASSLSMSFSEYMRSLIREIG